MVTQLMNYTTAFLLLSYTRHHLLNTLLPLLRLTTLPPRGFTSVRPRVRDPGARIVSERTKKKFPRSFPPFDCVKEKMVPGIAIISGLGNAVGTGGSTARLFASKGYKVALLSRPRPEIDSLKKEIISAGGIVRCAILL